MIRHQPEPPALPGMLPPPPGPVRRVCDLARRYWWEALPFYVAVPVGTAVELHAATGPGWETPLFYSVSGLVLGAVAYLARAHKPAAFGLGSAAGACQWATAVTAGAPTVPALIVGTAAAVGASTQYWRLLGQKREEQVKRDHAVELAQLDVMKAYAAAGRLPAQREQPAIETVPAAEQEQPRESVPWQPPGNTSVRQRVPVGPNTDIDIVGGHILIAGRTRAGKSVIQNGIISSLLPCEDALVVGIDMKFGGVELRPYEKVGVRVAFNADDAEELIDWVIEQARRRGEKLGVSFEDTGSIQKAHYATPAEPHIVLVIDEVAELTRQAPKTAAKIETILAVTTGLGVTAVLGTQLSSSGVFGGRTDGPANIDTVVCLGTKSPMHTRMILGEDATKLGYDAHLLEHQGEFYIRSHRHRRVVVDRSFNQTDRMLEDHLHALDRGPRVAEPHAEPEAFTAPAEPVVEQSGRLENATALITEYLREHGPATPQEIADGIGHPTKEPTVRTLCARHFNSGFYGKDKRGTYWVAGSKTVAGNVVRLATRRNS